MLTRALFLALSWLVVAAVTTMLAGRRLQRSALPLSLGWLAAVILLGDLWALLTFGLPGEIAVVSALAFLFGAWWIWRLPDWNALGQVAWAKTLLTALLYLGYSLGVTLFSPLHPVSYFIAVIFFFLEVAALGLALTFAYETLDVGCRLRWKRRVAQIPPVPGYTPKVSLHVPAYNEPPEVVEETLRALARLDYADYEVLLVDNNTPDPATWRPLEQVCEELGPRFRCLHLDNWPGYKSGALNFALTQTAPDAEIVGIVDADYQVAPGYLSDLVPAFAAPDLAFLQTPQDYREHHGNPFMEACYHAYKYFFDVSMPARNEHNAIIFGGTMGLIRKSVLLEIGGWDEWCITEDAEASLRILKQGYRSLFVNRTYGRGLMPFSFDGLKKQRFRWCFGGIQILRKHWQALMPWSHYVDPDNRLTLAQRYYYLVGGLQWFNDLLNLAFAFFLVLGGLLILTPLGIRVRPLAGPLLVVPAVFLLLGLWRFLWALHHMLDLSLKESLLAMANFFSLGWAVSLGAIQGLVQPAGVFMRTPKSRSRSGVVRAVKATRWETGIGLICTGTALTLIVHQPRPATLFLGALLLWQAGLYLAAPFYSLLSIYGRELPALTSRGDIGGLAVEEGRAARWAVALLLLLLISLCGLQAIPLPEARPDYARLEPAQVPVERVVGLERVPFSERALGPFSLPPADPTATPSPTSTPTATTPVDGDPLAQPTPADLPPPTATPVPAGPAATPLPSATAPPAATSPGATPAPPTPTPTPPATASPQPTEPAPTGTPSATGAAPTATPLPTNPAPTRPVPTATPLPTEPAATNTPLPTAPIPTEPAATNTPLPTEPVPTNPAPTNTAVPTAPAPTNPAPTPPGPP